VTFIPVAASGPVLIIRSGRGATADMARALESAGWLKATPGTIGRDRPAIIVLEATDHAGAAISRIGRVRQSAEGVPLLFLTTRGIFEDLLAAGTLPRDGYLVAPFTPADVVLRLRWLTRSGSVARRDAELTVGDLTLRPRWFLACRDGHQIPLTKTQCAVLQLLMQNTGNVVRKEEIANHVWPANPGRGGSNVELYISYLRRKINAAGPPMIHTLRGIGYLIKPAPAGPAAAATGNREAVFDAGGPL
jgi:two-component system OmpR family response regulator